MPQHRRRRCPLGKDRILEPFHSECQPLIIPAGRVVETNKPSLDHINYVLNFLLSSLKLARKIHTSMQTAAGTSDTQFIHFNVWCEAIELGGIDAQ